MYSSITYISKGLLTFKVPNVQNMPGVTPHSNFFVNNTSLEWMRDPSNSNNDNRAQKLGYTWYITPFKACGQEKNKNNKGSLP